jgi:hypothetical protein
VNAVLVVVHDVEGDRLALVHTECGEPSRLAPLTLRLESLGTVEIETPTAAAYGLACSACFNWLTAPPDVLGELARARRPDHPPTLSWRNWPPPRKPTGP